MELLTSNSNFLEKETSNITLIQGELNALRNKESANEELIKLQTQQIAHFKEKLDQFQKKLTECEAECNNLKKTNFSVNMTLKWLAILKENEEDQLLSYLGVS